MKILLRHKTTGLYFQEPDNWVHDVEAASDFRTSQEAIDRVRLEYLANVEVTAIFPSGNHVDSICYQIKPSQPKPRLRT